MAGQMTSFYVIINKKWHHPVERAQGYLVYLNDFFVS